MPPFDVKYVENESDFITIPTMCAILKFAIHCWEMNIIKVKIAEREEMPEMLTVQKHPFYPYNFC